VCEKIRFISEPHLTIEQTDSGRRNSLQPSTFAPFLRRRSTA